MTLVLALADETSIHMSCDFRLTNHYTGEVVEDNAHKLVSVNAFEWSGLIGVTGVGVLDGLPVGRWIARLMSRTGPNASFEDVLEALKVEAEAPLSRVRDLTVRRHTFVVGAMIGSQSFVGLVSNYESLGTAPIPSSQHAADELTVGVMKPKRPKLFLAGVVDSVSEDERQALEFALRSRVPEEDLQLRLSQVNVAASRRDAERQATLNRATGKSQRRMLCRVHQCDGAWICATFPD